jgi:apolipoprotein N-acyltransferase
VKPFPLEATAGSGLGVPWAALIAATAGALAVLAFPPFGLSPALVVSLAVLQGLLVGRRPGEGFVIGWSFGLGLLGFGIFWIRVSLNEFGNMGVWLAHLLTLIFIMAMALYYGLLGGLTAWLAGRRGGWAAPLLIFPALWILLEWLRGWFLTGFPWLNAGDSQVEGPLAGYVPLLGVYGVSLLVALSAGLLWRLVAGDRVPRRERRLGQGLGSGLAPRLAPGAGRRHVRWALAGALALIWLAGLGLARLEWTQVAGEPFRAAVLQANIPQSLKWNEESLYPTLRAYVELTREAFDQGGQVIVWPETAIPEFLDRVREPLLEPLAAEAGEAGAHLVIGLPVLDYEEQTYFNGLISLGAGEEDLYRKRHLVPFGEFMPWRSLLGPLAQAFAVPMSDFSAGDAERPLLRVGPHQVGASICYEDAFPAEVIQALPEAAYLINVSNDAWFGDSLAPHQHLGIARMRALETGRWMVRATNTGISAIIDHRGQVRGTVPAFQRGLFSALVQPRTGSTPFVRFGNALPLGLALAMLGLALLARRRRGRAT